MVSVEFAGAKWYFHFVFPLIILGEVLNKPTTGKIPPGKNPSPPNADYYSPDNEK